MKMLNHLKVEDSILKIKKQKINGCNGFKKSKMTMIQYVFSFVIVLLEMNLIHIVPQSVQFA